MDLRWCVAVLVAVMLLPMARGQDGTASQVSLEDATGDVHTTVAGTPATGGATAYPGADLVTLRAVETPFSITFTLGLAAIPSSKDPGVDGVDYQIYFTHNSREFRITSGMTLPILTDTFSNTPFAFLEYRDPGTDWSFSWSGDALLDKDAKTLTFDLDRQLLADKDGAAPFPGRTLEAIHAHSHAAFGSSNISIFNVPTKFPQDVFDDAPDDPTLGARLPILFGIAQTGHARLTSDQPFRASNGEATTFVYNVTAHNIGEEKDTFQLAVNNVPPGYTVVLPVPVVALDAGGNHTVPVLVTMPFGHQHGALASMVVEMTSLSDSASIGRVQIGVRFLAVPQPAGHHDTVYLHTLPASSTLPFFSFSPEYLNTLEDDPSDAKANAYSGGLGGSGTEWTYSWFYTLQPGLQMGLDVDPAKIGHLYIPVGTTIPMLKTTMEATLFAGTGGFFFSDGTVELATMAPTAPVDLLANSQAALQGDLVPVKGTTRIPYEPGNNLYLEIQITTNVPDATLNLAKEGLYIAPGGSAKLPLREWHDAVDQVLSTIGGPGLSPLGEQERLVNPGETVSFPFSVANPSNRTSTIKLEVSGANKEWAVLSPESITTPAHGTAQGTLVVRAPASAVDGERADLVLQAFNKDDPTARGLVRLVAIVDTDADQVDDSAAAANAVHKKSPDAGGFVCVSVIALLAVALRRRDD